MNKLKLYRPGDWAWNTTADERSMAQFEQAYRLMIRLEIMRKVRMFNIWADEYNQLLEDRFEQAN